MIPELRHHSGICCFFLTVTRGQGVASIVARPHPDLAGFLALPGLSLLDRQPEVTALGRYLLLGHPPRRRPPRGASNLRCSGRSRPFLRSPSIRTFFPRRVPSSNQIDRDSKPQKLTRVLP